MAHPTRISAFNLTVVERDVTPPRASPSSASSKPPPVAKKPPPGRRTTVKPEEPLSVIFPPIPSLFGQEKARAKKTVTKQEIEAYQGQDYLTKLPDELQLEIAKDLPSSSLNAVRRAGRFGSVMTTDRLKQLCSSHITYAEILPILHAEKGFGLYTAEVDSFAYFYRGRERYLLLNMTLEEEDGDGALQTASELHDMSRDLTGFLPFYARGATLDPNTLLAALRARVSCERNTPGFTREMLKKLYDPLFWDAARQVFHKDSLTLASLDTWDWTMGDYRVVRPWHQWAAAFTTWVQATTFQWPPADAVSELNELALGPEEDEDEVGQDKAQLILTRLRIVREELLSSTQ